MATDEEQIREMPCGLVVNVIWMAKVVVRIMLLRCGSVAVATARPPPIRRVSVRGCTHKCVGSWPLCHI